MAKNPLRPGAVKRILEVTAENYPGYDRDKEMNAVALFGVAHVMGALAAWLLHHQGEKALEKAIAMTAKIIHEQAHTGADLIKEMRGTYVNLLNAKDGSEK